MAETHTRVIRALGSGTTHVADVHHSTFHNAVFVGPFVGVEMPVATRCGSLLRGREARDLAVCMKAGTKVTCSRCRRLTGIAVAAEGNEHALARTLREANHV